MPSRKKIRSKKMSSVNKGKEAKEVQDKPMKEGEPEATKKQFLFDWKATKNGSTICPATIHSRSPDSFPISTEGYLVIDPSGMVRTVRPFLSIKPQLIRLRVLAIADIWSLSFDV